MSKKIFFYIVIVLALAAIASLLVGRAQIPKEASIISTGTTGAGFATSVPQYDFGSISMAKGNVDHDFALKNDTQSDIIIKKAYTSCMCTETILNFADGSKVGPLGMPGHMPVPDIEKTIKAGKTLFVSAIFNPAAHGPAGIGPIERQIILETDKGQYMLGFKAVVTP